jgi:large subunit ribosomal protein L45
MWTNMKFKTVRWQWIESLEEPTVKHIVTREMLNASTLYGQVTVRFHSKQLLAVYDRFGRLAFGSETVPKDVIEYVVFEKFLTNIYGVWRMHDKIVPDWAAPQSPVIRSYRQPKLFKVDDSVKKVEISKFKKDDSHLKEDEASIESGSGGGNKANQAIH